MRLAADHLVRSRHGIWYYRLVMPRCIRQQYPNLPKELKRSTGTADIRKARQSARLLHVAVWRLFLDPVAMSRFSEPDFRSWTIKLDKAGRPREIQATPEEQDRALEAYERLRQMEAVIDREMRGVTPAPRRAATRGAAVPRIGTPITLSAACRKYVDLQLQTNVWSEQTARYTHEPSLRLFRELVGEPMQSPDDSGAMQDTIDLSCADLTVAKVEKFIEDFRKYPDQQGRRTARLSAHAALASGGKPQSLNNFFKRLEHVKQFVKFCSDKGYVPEPVLREITIVLAKDTKRARDHALKAQSAVDGIVADGYLPFNDADVQHLFGPSYMTHVANNAARYWIPLISLYAGLRVGEVSQLRPIDFDQVDGIWCIRIRLHSPQTLAQEGGSQVRRVKTLAAIRTVPIHPKLLDLGLLAYVDQRRTADRKWMWDGLRWSDKDGFGKYPSRDFKLLAQATGVHVPRRKVLHSFRSTLSQRLEKDGLELELIDRLIGHEPKSTRATNYGRSDDGRSFPVARVFAVLSKVAFPVDVPPWLQPRPARPTDGT